MADHVYISRVKRDSAASAVLLEACRLAALDGRDFSITDIFDEKIGSCTEFMISTLGGQALPIRDYFAGQALNGFMSRTLIPGFDDDMIAERSYQIADRMLWARMQVDE